ncbi:hypothetical protein B9Q02_09175, partial [Candidatus Marsarchaeota G1 archaeon BE_D]
EEHLPSLFPLKGTRRNLDDSPLFSCGGSSGAPYCPSNEKCNPESMRGTMIPLGGNPRPFQGGETSEHTTWKKRTTFVTELRLSIKEE